MKSIDIIQIMSKVARVLSMVAFVGSIVGICVCLLGIILAGLGVGETIKLGGVTLHGLIDKTGYDYDGIYAFLSAWLIVCIGEAVLAHFAANYFKNELAIGTPFTKSGAKELLRLGILTAVLPLVAQIAATICARIMCAVLDVSPVLTENMHIENGDSVILGVAFIVISLLCRYGAELQETN